MKGLVGLMVAIAAGDRAAVSASLDALPRLATERLARPDERFIAECQVQVCAEPLHAAVSGAGSGAAKLEQRIIIQLLDEATCA
ncbi:hypothetical protein AB0L70_29970 [Kribbella sp. NPDC051952]|uniref:hypothetical protein n=1 Tax=Kribbella sp. NPDC051952 TaxID=3154851 RepID=UPI00342371E9